MEDDILKQLPAVVVALYVIIKKYAPDILSTSKDSKCVTKEDFDELEKKVNKYGDKIDEHAKDIGFIQGKLSK